MFTSGGNAIYLILFFLIPVLWIIYLTTASDPMWFMSSSKVGWMWVIINGFGMLLLAASMWGIDKSVFMDMAMARRLDWFSVISLLLYVVGLFLLIKTAIIEFVAIGVLMILGSAGGSSYMGEFTDRNGNRWEVWRK